MTKILIVEDEARIASFIEMGLRAAGFTTVVAATGPDGLELAQGDGIDLVVLDLGLPGMDGLSVLRELRACGSQVPVVILTARDGVEDLVSGFDAGAQDYVAKPFRFQELLARIRARLGGEAAEQTSSELSGSGVRLNLLARKAFTGGVEVELSSREFALAEEFLRHQGQVLSRAQLLNTVWGFDFDPGSNVVDVYVAYLRKKLGAHCIETVRGAGYRWVTA